MKTHVRTKTDILSKTTFLDFCEKLIEKSSLSQVHSVSAAKELISIAKYCSWWLTNNC